MGHMRVADVVEEVIQEAIGAIHRGQRSPQPIPLGVFVVRQLGVRVLQQRDGDQPAVHDQVWNYIYLQTCGWPLRRPPKQYQLGLLRSKWQ